MAGIDKHQTVQLTTAVLVTQVREPPHISQTHGQADAREEEIQFITPATAFYHDFRGLVSHRFFITGCHFFILGGRHCGRVGKRRVERQLPILIPEESPVRCLL